MCSGPFSFWPQFISYFVLIPEQEAKIRQICGSNFQKIAGIGVKPDYSETPAGKVDLALEYMKDGELLV